MRLLIDTQVFIWLINEDKRLNVEVLEALSTPSNQVYISYFSFFEMAIKASTGKLNYDRSILNDLPKMGIELIMPSNEVLSTYKIFNSDNKDPFDNILIAVARNHKCIFVTADPKILTVSSPGLRFLDAA